MHFLDYYLSVYFHPTAAIAADVEVIVSCLRGFYIALPFNTEIIRNYLFCRIIIVIKKIDA